MRCRGRRRRAADSHPSDHRSRPVSAPAVSPAAESSRPARVAGSSTGWTAFVIAAMVVFAVLTAATAVQRHHQYRTYRNDMGNMVQVVDNTAHGRILQMTGSDGRQISRLAAHVDPIIAVFALPWLVWPDPAMLLVAQAAARRTRRLAGLPPRPPRAGRHGGRGPLRRRGPPLPAAAVRRARRVPPRHARHPAAALRLRLPRGGQALARRPVPRAGRPVQGGDPAGDRPHGPVLRPAQAHAVAAAHHRGRRRCTSCWPWAS